MTQSLSPLDSLLVTIVLATLTIGLPVFFVLAIRFFWDRHLHLGRSKELEKLIWQLHRIASAMEHQMNLSFPAVQPGTEEARDLAFLQPLAPRPASATPVATTPAAPAAKPVALQPAMQQPAAQQPAVQQPVTPPPAEEQGDLPPLQRREPSVAAPRAGVNSMFDL
jgi:hypothetical protein